MNNVKRQKKIIEWKRLEISSRKWSYQGNISSMDMTKDRNSKDLTEAEKIKK